MSTRKSSRKKKIKYTKIQELWSSFDPSIALSIKLKRKLYRVAVRPITLFGLECWQSRKKKKNDVNEVRAVELKMWGLSLS